MNTLHPKGFLFSTSSASIKKPGRYDLALIYSEKDAVMSGMFTTNRIKAAPVKLNMKRIKRGKGRAIIVNSGNANACTGQQGMKDALKMTALTAKGLGLKQSDVYACSTGVIGVQMPMQRIIPKISELITNLGKSTIDDVAKAIMTTDTFPKAVSKTIMINDKEVIISAVCKGAGMIYPNMATMLCFIMTDASIEKNTLNRLLKDAVNKSFNRITVDGDMSTNDTVLIMANGLAGNSLIKNGTTAFRVFSNALEGITYELAKMIVKDGEGATKLIEIQIKNAKSNRDAAVGAFAIANSMLVKTAIYGNDANWGRIMAALGYSGITLKEEKIDIYLNGLKLVNQGIGTNKDTEAAERLKSKEVKILIDLHMGKGSSKILTCDLTEDYIKINAEYRT